MAQTWVYWQLILHSKTACEVYDEIWCPELARLSCNNGKDCYETDFDLAHMFYGRGQIKRHHRWQKFIADLLHGWSQIKRHHRWGKCIADMFYIQGPIKRHHCRQMFYVGRWTIMFPQKYTQTRRCKEWDIVWGIFSYKWSAEIF